MASRDLLVDGLAPGDSLRRASINERNGRTALFAAAVCMIGTMVFLVGEIGCWTLLAGPAYLAGAAIATMLAHGRAHAMLAVAIATGSTWVLVGIARLTGLV